MKRNLKNKPLLSGKEDAVIPLFGRNRVSHHSEALGTGWVSDGVGAVPWPPWSPEVTGREDIASFGGC